MYKISQFHTTTPESSPHALTVMFIVSHSMILFITRITTTKKAMNTSSLKLIPASPMTTKSHLQIKMTNKSTSTYLSEPQQKNIWSSTKISAKTSLHSFL